MAFRARPKQSGQRAPQPIKESMDNLKAIPLTKSQPAFYINVYQQQNYVSDKTLLSEKCLVNLSSKQLLQTLSIFNNRSISFNIAPFHFLALN